MANNGRARHAFFHFAQVEDWLQSPALAGTLVNDMLICSKPCQGLNLISTINDDFLCNPSTGAIQCLGRLGKSHFTPQPPIHRHHRRHTFSVGRTIGFGFDKSTGDHVAVEIGYICGALACMVKTSSEKHWSCIGKPPRPVTDMPPAHVDGKLYWMSEPAQERLVLVFDISTRAFGILPCEPCSGNDNSRHAFLVELNGTLSVVVVSAGTEEMNIWMVSKHNSTWVCAYKICLDKQPDYSLKAGRVVMPVDMDSDNGRILLNTGRALGFYDTKTGALDTLYSLDQLKLPHSNFAFPVLCQESLARIQDDQLPIRVAPSVRDQGFRPCRQDGENMDKDLPAAASTWDTSSQGQSPRIELPGFEDGDNMSKDIPAAASTFDTSSQGQDLRIELPGLEDGNNDIPAAASTFDTSSKGQYPRIELPGKGGPGSSAIVQTRPGLTMDTFLPPAGDFPEIVQLFRILEFA
ncbi:hypothetical protein ACQ4PT_068117 [Festuca glaucescens]